jgi:hypothetical protein
MSFPEDVHGGSKRSENGAVNNFQDLQKVFIHLKWGFLMTKQDLSRRPQRTYLKAQVTSGRTVLLYSDFFLNVFDGNRVNIALRNMAIQTIKLSLS